MALLNTADKLYLGSSQVDAAYLGATKVFPAFKPSAITGLAVWLDASSLSGSAGSAVDPWPNKVAGGPPGTMVGTPAPKISTNTLNGKKLVRFTVSEGRMRMTGHSVELTYTLAYVARGAPGGSYLAGRFVTAVYPPTNFLVGYWNGFEDVGYSTSGSFWLPDNRPSVSTSWHLVSSDAGPGDTAWSPRMFSNGVFLNQSTATVGNRGQDGWLGSLNISGYDAASAAETCDIEMAELILYDHQLTDPERVQVESYLRSKWGL
jgi:hypothetical protein